MKNTDVKNNAFATLSHPTLSVLYLTHSSKTQFISTPVSLLYRVLPVPPKDQLLQSLCLMLAVRRSLCLSFGDSGFRSVSFLHQEVCKIIYRGENTRTSICAYFFYLFHSLFWYRINFMKSKYPTTVVQGQTDDRQVDK